MAKPTEDITEGATDEPSDEGTDAWNGGKDEERV